MPPRSSRIFGTTKVAVRARASILSFCQPTAARAAATSTKQHASERKKCKSDSSLALESLKDLHQFANPLRVREHRLCLGNRQLGRALEYVMPTRHWRLQRAEWSPFHFRAVRIKQ